MAINFFGVTALGTNGLRQGIAMGAVCEDPSSAILVARMYREGPYVTKPGSAVKIRVVCRQFTQTTAATGSGCIGVRVPTDLRRQSASEALLCVFGASNQRKGELRLGAVPSVEAREWFRPTSPHHPRSSLHAGGPNGSTLSRSEAILGCDGRNLSKGKSLPTSNRRSHRALLIGRAASKQAAHST